MGNGKEGSEVGSREKREMREGGKRVVRRKRREVGEGRRRA